MTFRSRCGSATVYVTWGCLALVCTAEIFSSVSKMKALPAAEKQLLDRFGVFLESVPEDSLPEQLKWKLRALQNSNRKSLKNISLVECPLHAFRLVTRLVRQWPAVLKVAQEAGGTFKDLAAAARQWINGAQLWPTDVDLAGAANALVRLHHLYNLPYAALVGGRFLNVTSQPMSSKELSSVTKAALKLGFICDAVELFSLLEALSAKGKGVAEVEKLREDVSQHTLGSTNECETYHNVTVPVPFLAASMDRVPDASRRRVMETLFHQICRRSVKASILYGDGKHCFLQSSYIPYLRFKAELVNVDPFIIVFHDVISDAEISEMKELSFGKLAPSTLAAQVEDEQQMVRVSQNAWLFDQSEVISRVSRRIHVITGLSTRITRVDTHAEPYQVLNYGLGGVYGPHEDSVRISRMYHNEDSSPMFRNAGDRTATWMFYGAAAFWYNVKRSGQGDPRMVHAGCPVLYGDKWVANKWLREIGNVFTRPCLLEPHI